MASTNQIRKALMKLLGAQTDNAVGAGTRSDPAGTAQALQGARQQAREVQGSDPLASPASSELERARTTYMPDDVVGGFEPPTPRTQQLDALRLPNENMTQQQRAGLRTRQAGDRGRQPNPSGPDFAQREASMREAEAFAEDGPQPIQGDPTFQTEMDYYFSKFIEVTGRKPPLGMPDEEVKKIVDGVIGPNSGATPDDIPF